MTQEQPLDKLSATTQQGKSSAVGNRSSLMADLDKIANSTATVVSTRLVILVLPVLMTIIGYFASSKLDEIKDTQKAFWQIVGTMNNNIGDIKTSSATITANFESHRREDDQFENTVKAAIQDHENRLRMISQPPVRP